MVHFCQNKYNYSNFFTLFIRSKIRKSHVTKIKNKTSKKRIKVEAIEFEGFGLWSGFSTFTFFLFLSVIWSPFYNNFFHYQTHLCCCCFPKRENHVVLVRFLPQVIGLQKTRSGISGTTLRSNRGPPKRRRFLAIAMETPSSLPRRFPFPFRQPPFGTTRSKHRYPKSVIFPSNEIFVFDLWVCFKF